MLAVGIPRRGGMTNDIPIPSQARGTEPSRFRRLLADGYRWVVTEVAAPRFDRRGGTHLMFDGETVMRRVRVFPANWYELADDELYALSLHFPHLEPDGD